MVQKAGQGVRVGEVRVTQGKLKPIPTDEGAPKPVGLGDAPDKATQDRPLLDILAQQPAPTSQPEAKE